MKAYRIILSCLFLATAMTVTAQNRTKDPNPEFKVIVNTASEPVGEGDWAPTVESLSAWECPEWFRDAKFGIWAHWGPQCEPEDGDWYARNMYDENSQNYRYNIDTRDHPSRFGFKDWIHEWKAENWDPDALIKLYKETGARYFMTLANHHDNFDLFDSKYQSWNSVALGPEKDIVGGWAEACRKYGLRLGVSVHAAHAWSWYETSRGADTKGPLAGVPYDGWLTKEDGAGTWWEGLDPQELYEQRHPLSPNNRLWDWEEDRVTTPDQAYCDKIYNRTVQLIDDYNPDIVYFDDTYLPLWPVSDAGLKILAHGYNRSAAANGGKPELVFTGKVLTDWQKATLLWDVERGAPDAIQELPWQTCTCIGEWHYNKHVYYEDRYKSAAQVVTMLVDVVSKNGNLLLSIPLKADGTLDPTEQRIVKEIGHWMQINGESIYDTRPWVVFGEGPSVENKNPINAQGFNEGRVKLSAADLRFNKKGDKTIYVTVMGIPEDDITVKSLGTKTAQNSRKIKSVTLLGSDEKIAWTQAADKLTITKPSDVPSPEAVVFKVTLK
ncbi:MAG: alpha-L-fucosidase [Bacteroidales bacterium]|nr:alpha-L-fucosidase [Bacteroidales bacterium]